MKINKDLQKWIDLIEAENVYTPKTLKYAYILSIIENLRTKSCKGMVISGNIAFDMIKELWKQVHFLNLKQTENGENGGFLFKSMLRLVENPYRYKEPYTFNVYCVRAPVRKCYDACFSDIWSYIDNAIGNQCDSELVSYDHLWKVERIKDHLVYVINNLDKIMDGLDLLRELTYYKWAEQLTRCNDNLKNVKVSNKSYNSFKNKLLNQFGEKIKHRHIEKIITIDDLYHLISRYNITTSCYINESLCVCDGMEGVNKVTHILPVIDDCLNQENNNIEKNNYDEKDLIKNNDENLFLDHNDMLIEDLNLSVRSYNALKRANINKLSEIKALGEKGLYNINNMGGNSINEVISKLSVFPNFWDDGSIDKSMIFPFTIDDLPLSVRSYNALNINGYNIINDIVALSYTQLLSLKGMNITGANEVYDVLREFLNTKYVIDAANTFKNVSENLKELNVEIPIQIKLFKLGVREIVDLCILKDSEIEKLDGPSFRTIFYLKQKLLRATPQRYLVWQKMLKGIEKNNHFLVVRGIFGKQIDNKMKSLNVYTIKDLTSLSEEEFSIFDYEDFDILLKISKLSDNVGKQYIQEFTRILLHVKKPESITLQENQYYQIIKNRALNKTLVESAEAFGLTRERSRQIEAIFVDKNDELIESSEKYQMFVKSLFVGGVYLNVNLINKLFEKFANEFIFYLKKSEIHSCIEDDKTKYIYSQEASELINLFLLESPENFQQNELDSMGDKLCNYMIESGLFMSVKDSTFIIKSNYIIYGDVYSKSTIKNADLLLKLLQKYYPKGILIYNADVLQDIRFKFQKEYKMDITLTNRYLETFIQTRGVMIGKGKYIISDSFIMSEDLSTKIYNYLKQSNKTLFLMNSLYSLFYKELHAEKITSKYMLQGALKQRFADTLYFRRDYVSTTKDIPNAYEDIYNYVKRFSSEVSLEQIKQEFPGVPISVINNCLANENIIKFSGTYIHAEKVKMDDMDIELFALAMNDVLFGYEYSNTYVLFDYLTKNNSLLLQKYNIDNQFKLFSIIQYYLQEQYEFRRPYFAHEGVEIGHVKERIIAYIKDNKRVTFDELKEEFPEALDTVLFNVLSGENIIYCQKYYIHGDNLFINVDDVQILKSIIKNLCLDGKIHSSHELFLILDFKHADIVEKYDIDGQFKLFSILKYLFSNEFEFSRPYFANKGVLILSRTDRVTEFLRQYDEIRITDLYKYIYDNRLALASITEYINEMKDEYVFKDKETIVSIEKSKINKYNAQVAENVLLNAIGSDGFVVASKFKNYKFLPNDVQWTDWLLYSCMNKFSNKIKVMQTESWMKRSEPVFVLKSIPANNIEELKSYLKATLKMNDTIFVGYLQNKGLLS